MPQPTQSSLSKPNLGQPIDRSREYPDFENDPRYRGDFLLKQIIVESRLFGGQSVDLALISQLSSNHSDQLYNYLLIRNLFHSFSSNSKSIKLNSCSYFLDLVAKLRRIEFQRHVVPIISYYCKTQFLKVLEATKNLQSDPAREGRAIRLELARMSDVDLWFGVKFALGEMKLSRNQRSAFNSEMRSRGFGSNSPNSFLGRSEIIRAISRHRDDLLFPPTQHMNDSQLVSSITQEEKGKLDQELEKNIITTKSDEISNNTINNLNNTSYILIDNQWYKMREPVLLIPLEPVQAPVKQNHTDMTDISSGHKQPETNQVQVRSDVNGMPGRSERLPGMFNRSSDRTLEPAPKRVRLNPVSGPIDTSTTNNTTQRSGQNIRPEIEENDTSSDDGIMPTMPPPERSGKKSSSRLGKDSSRKPKDG